MKLKVDAHYYAHLIHLQTTHAIHINPGKPLVECGKISFTNLYDLEYFS